MNRKVKDKDIKHLYGLSAARCNICSKQLIFPRQDAEGYVHIGEMAHIVAYADNECAPRYIDGEAYNNDYSNLILLCPNHHKEVDDNPECYTIDRLLQIKSEFERDIAKKLGNFNINEDDKFLVKTIQSEFQLQNLYYLLNNNFDRLPLEIDEIQNIYQLLLEPNYPSLYPFKDKVLTEYFEKMRSYYWELYPFIVKYYFPIDNCNWLVPPHDKPIVQEDKVKIDSILKNLRSSLLNWLNYCKKYD